MIDLRANLLKVEAHNHTKQPNLFVEPEELDERVEPVTEKDALSFYVFHCLFLNIRIDNHLYSIVTTKDLDGTKALVILSDSEPPRVESTFTLERFPVRYRDVKNPRLNSGEETSLLLVPASHKETKLFTFLPEGIGAKFDDGLEEDHDLYAGYKQFIVGRWGVLRDVFHDLVSCYTLASWVRELFPSVAFLAATGKTGTGKSVLIMILEALGFLAIDLASITGPAIAYIDEFYHPFLLHDECQSLNNYRNPDVAEKVAILNSRYKHRAKRVKMRDATGHEPRTVEVQRLYGPTAIAGTELPASLGILDRILHLPSIYSNPKKVPDDIESEREAAILRCRALAFRSRHLFDDFAVYRKEFDEALDGCAGRVRELAYAILYIAKTCATPNTFDALVQLFKGLDQKRKDESAVGEQGDILSAYGSGLEEQFNIDGTTDVLVATVLKNVNEGKSEKDCLSSQRLGLKIKSLGFTTYKDSKKSTKRIKFEEELVRLQLASHNISLPAVPCFGRVEPLDANAIEQNGIEKAATYTCEVCGKPASPITRLGESNIRSFCSEHLGNYTGDL